MACFWDKLRSVRSFGRQVKYIFTPQSLPSRHISEIDPNTSSLNVTQTRHLNFLSVFNKEKIAREKQRLNDELNRGYFDDFKELKQNHGKFGLASKTLTPVAASPQFPETLVRTTENTSYLLPRHQSVDGSVNESKEEKATLICFTFRANGQPMVESWSKPFSDAFYDRKGISLFEVSVIESSFLGLPIIRNLLLCFLRTSPNKAQDDRRAHYAKIVYLFGDQWWLRKALGMTNRLTAYTFLIDEQGRVRWRSSGYSSVDEVSAMVGCTEQLLEQQARQR